MKLWLVKVGKSDACIRPLFANLITNYIASCVISEYTFGNNDQCLFLKTYCFYCFLNQARAGHRPVRAWFLRIASVRELQYVCVCLPPRLLITSGVMCCDIDPIRLVE